MDSFSIIVLMNFAAEGTDGHDVEAQLVKAFVNAKDFVHFSILRWNMSSNVSRWAILVRGFFKK